MNAKVTIIKSRTNKDGEHPIFVILRSKGKRKLKQTSVCVEVSDWDYTNERLRHRMPVAPDHPNYEQYQRYRSTRGFIEDKQKAYDNKIEELVKTGKPFTMDRLIELVENPVQQSISVFSLFDARIKEFERDERHGQVRIYKDTLNRVKHFFKNKDLMFFEFSESELMRFRKYLVDRGNAPGTIFRHLRTVRAMWNIAIDRQIARQNDYPFRKNSDIMAGLKVSFNSKPLTRAQIDEIRSLDHNKIPEGSELWHARNYFIFMYVGHGHNFADLSRFKWSDIQNGRIHYVRYKTRGKVQTMGSFEITDELQRILGWYRKHWREIKQLHNPYIFPILNGFHQSEKQKITRSEKVRKTVNASLKEIGEMIGAR